MADFFEQLGKKISDVAEDFGKKTEDTLEVQRIKSQIRSLDRANERDYIERDEREEARVCYHSCSKRYASKGTFGKTDA